jgi:hypothetical protein
VDGLDRTRFSYPAVERDNEEDLMRSSHFQLPAGFLTPRGIRGTIFAERGTIAPLFDGGQNSSKGGDKSEPQRSAEVSGRVIIRLFVFVNFSRKYRAFFIQDSYIRGKNDQQEVLL